MELYRCVNKEEFEQITNGGLIELKLTKFWSRNESLITNLFYTKNNNKRRNRKLLINFVNYYINVYHIVLPDVPGDTPCGNQENENVYYDIFTDITNILNLSINTYCQCWSESKDIVKGIKRWFKKPYAVLKATINDNCPLLDNTVDTSWDASANKDSWNGKGYLKVKKITYINFTNKSALFDLMDEFINKDRCFGTFYSCIKRRYKNQKERRVTFICNNPLRNAGSFGEYTHCKYGYYTIGDFNDLIDALVRFCDYLFDNYLKETVTIKIPNNLITSIDVDRKL